MGMRKDPFTLTLLIIAISLVLTVGSLLLDANIIISIGLLMWTFIVIVLGYVAYHPREFGEV